MVLKLRYYGDPILRRRAADVASFGPELEGIVRDMVETMEHEEGVGLAAPQVGLDMQLLIARRMSDADDEEAEAVALINPVITARSRETWELEEGCLSIPGIRGNVTRPTGITVSYRDPRGAPHAIEADGMFARVLQHEIDHLDGRLFIDYLSAAQKALLKPRLRKLADRLSG